VTKVYARFQELLHRDNCHWGFLLVFSTLCVVPRGHCAHAQHKHAIDKGA